VSLPKQSSKSNNFGFYKPAGAYQEAGFRRSLHTRTGMDTTSLEQESEDVGMAFCSSLA